MLVVGLSGWKCVVKLIQGEKCFNRIVGTSWSFKDKYEVLPAHKHLFAISFFNDVFEQHVKQSKAQYFNTVSINSIWRWFWWTFEIKLEVDICIHNFVRNLRQYMFPLLSTQHPGFFINKLMVGYVVQFTHIHKLHHSWGDVASWNQCNELVISINAVLECAYANAPVYTTYLHVCFHLLAVHLMESACMSWRCESSSE